ncbi:glycosyltransferase family 2 protein [Thalassobius sp. S69A]|uniref:glycosyltransferase family 2 protein n=1 Tax=unclassified Thalassovita TaxID=2619711 RepID=UPI000C1084D3|nr:glycosyltransferase [Paracoccaceae bacterium]MBT26972.1 glycosyltransferase [Paracoccaceae bacterium]
MSNAEQSEWGNAGRLVAVVVTHNRLDKLKATLARLLAQPRPLLQAVVVVDNVSTDGTGDWLAAQDDPRLVVQTSAGNIGGAGGFENGMKLAVQRFDPDWLVVMDDDARPEPDAFAAFHDLAPIQWDGIAAAVYFPDGQICEMNRPSRNPFWHGREFLRTMFGGGRSGFHLDPSAYEGPARAIDVTSFVGFFISRAGVQRIGYPDGGLFLYGDDGLYTLGLRKAGGAIGFEPSVRFEHDCSTFGTHTQRGRFVPLWKVYFYHRNLLLLYKMAAGWLFWPALMVILPKWLLKARAHRGERRAFLSLLGLAVLDGLRGDTTRGLDEIQARAQRADTAR